MVRARRSCLLLLSLFMLAILMINLTPIPPSHAQGTATPTRIPQVSISDFHLVSPTEGWLLADRLYWTKDSGQTWTNITPNLNGKVMAAVTFADNFHGVIIAEVPGGDAITAYAIAQTSDSGKTWTHVPLNLFSPEEMNVLGGPIIPSLQFLDAKTGWLVVKAMTSSNFDVGTLFKTNDGGFTWTKLHMPAHRAIGNPIGDPVHFVTDQVGWIESRTEGYQPENNLLYNTRDGGQTWQIQKINGLPQDAQWTYTMPDFINSLDGLLTVWVNKNDNYTSNVYITHDGGLTWQLDGTLQGTGTAALLDSTHWIGVVYHHADVLRSSGQAGNPTILSQDCLITSISRFDFVSANSGLAESASWADTDSSKCPPQESLLYTNDGGKTWRPSIMPLP